MKRQAVKCTCQIVSRCRSVSYEQVRHPAPAGKAVVHMNFGFNSNVHARDAVYHVQTEDRGPSHPYLDTVVYETGRVVYKQSTSYEAFAATASHDANFAEQLHERLAQQHRDVIAQIEAGTLALSGGAKPQAEVPAARPSPLPRVTLNDGLDVRLMNPKTWLIPGGVTPQLSLEIELRRQYSGEAVADAEVEALLEHEKDRVHCGVEQTNADGRATLKFPMPAAASDGSSLVIRATDGSIYGELRFKLKAKHSRPAPVPVLK
jgi:hypothetical protein